MLCVLFGWFSATIPSPSTLFLQLSAFRAKLYASEATVLEKKEKGEGKVKGVYNWFCSFLQEMEFN